MGSLRFQKKKNLLYLKDMSAQAGVQAFSGAGVRLHEDRYGVAAHGAQFG